MPSRYGNLPLISVCTRWRQKIPGESQPAILAKSESSGFKWWPWLNKYNEKLKKIPDSNLRPIHIHIVYTCMHMYHIYTHTGMHTHHICTPLTYIHKQANKQTQKAINMGSIQWMTAELDLWPPHTHVQTCTHAHIHLYLHIHRHKQKENAGVCY